MNDPLDPFAPPPPPPNKWRVWIFAGAVVVGLALAVVLFRVVSRGGKGTTPATAAPSSSCGCAWPGTACVGAVCELAPSAKWTLSPMRVTFAASAGDAGPASNATVVLCSRPTGTNDWKCTKPARAAAPASAAVVQHADFTQDLAADAAIVVTTEALKGTGIDVEVRRADGSVAGATALHHKILRPGPALFNTGLRFGAKDKGVHDVLFKVKPVE